MKKYLLVFWFYCFCSKSIISINSSIRKGIGCHFDQETCAVTCYEDVKLLKNVIDSLAINFNQTGISKLNVYNSNNFSVITELLTECDLQSKLEELRIVNCSVKDLNFINFPDFQSLKLLDLRKNNLKTITQSQVQALNRISTVYLSENKWNCTNNLQIMLLLNSTVVKDLNNLLCQGDDHSGKPVIAAAKFLQDIESSCPKQCTCTLSYIVKDLETEALKPIVSVDCSNIDLYSLPDNLPRFTAILHLESNFIEDLSPLKNIIEYRTVQDIYLDDNRIANINILEGTYWLSHFRVLSLSGNQLTQIPTYAIENALEQNPNMPIALRMYLGDNPWKCDCAFTPGFQEILRKYEKIVHDIDEVNCAYLEGSENSLSPVLEVSISQICRLQTEYSFKGLDLLNIILACLIVLILGKLAYDFFHFKRTGKLPWIVTKMP